MSLAAGSRLGPYEILGVIGAGGMGEVYKARDTRLDRTVAIKVLPAAICSDPDRGARFEREAKTLAGLSHPHICTLYDVGDHAGSIFLVIEYLDGETLAHRLEKGALPLKQALTISTEIAEALSAAHRQGIIHRDLKPANIMLTRSGAKLLDFGLAKLIGQDGAVLPQMVSAPTRSAPLTGEGVIVGTLQYMAPEQLEGKLLDARTDLWALGTILYEMVTGRRAFEATSAASLIGAILEREPLPVAAFQPVTRPALDALVRQCLAKSSDDRPDTAHDVARELRWLGDSTFIGGQSEGPSHLHARRLLRSTALMLTSAAVSVALTSWVFLRSRSEGSSQVAIRSELNVKPATELNGGGVASTWIPTAGGSRTALTWTPDGRSIVFVGRRGDVRQLYVRALEATEARTLPGTEDAQVPAISPDGRWVAFWAAGKLKKVQLGGGPVMDLLNLCCPPTALIWRTNGELLWGDLEDRALWQLREGSSAARLTNPDGERHIPSSVLPNGGTVLYTVRRRGWTWGDEDVAALDVGTKSSRILLHDAVDARYVPTGHLIFLRRGALLFAPFDVGSLEVTGEPVPLMQDVAQALTGGNSANITGAGQFAISGAGTLAWLDAAGLVTAVESEIAAIDRRGGITAVYAPRRTYQPALRLSPDGRRLVLFIRELTEIGMWTYDLDRGRLTALHRDGEAGWPAWSPDGQRIAFALFFHGRDSLASQLVDGSASAQVFSDIRFAPSSWRSRTQIVGLSQGDVAVAEAGQTPIPVEPLQTTPATEQWPELSRDGRWLAFGSNASGRDEVYVQAYPHHGGRTLVSVDGGTSPAWHPSGRELFYVTPLNAAGKRAMMAVDFAPTVPPRVGTPRVLFDFDPRVLAFACLPIRCYDVANDGQHFYVVRTASPPPEPVVTHIELVQNWFEELKAKVPTK